MNKNTLLIGAAFVAAYYLTKPKRAPSGSKQLDPNVTGSAATSKPANPADNDSLLGGLFSGLGEIGKSLGGLWGGKGGTTDAKSGGGFFGSSTNAGVTGAVTGAGGYTEEASYSPQYQSEDAHYNWDAGAYTNDSGDILYGPADTVFEGPSMEDGDF